MPSPPQPPPLSQLTAVRFGVVSQTVKFLSYSEYVVCGGVFLTLSCGDDDVPMVHTPHHTTLHCQHLPGARPPDIEIVVK